VSIVRNPFTRFRSYCLYRAKTLNTTPEIVAFVREYYREDFEVFGDDLAFPPQA
jgi:hypothetical protein